MLFSSKNLVFHSTIFCNGLFWEFLNQSLVTFRNWIIWYNVCQLWEQQHTVDRVQLERWKGLHLVLGKFLNVFEHVPQSVKWDQWDLVFRIIVSCQMGSSKHSFLNCLQGHPSMKQDCLTCQDGLFFPAPLPLDKYHNLMREHVKI